MPDPALAPDDTVPAAAPLPPRSDAARAVAAHLHALWRYLRMHGASAHEADDLAQDAFVIALQKGALFLAPAATATFLRRTARFLFLRLRRSGRDAVVLADAVERLWAHDCAHDGGDQRLDALRQCLGELTERARRAIERSYALGGVDELGRAAVAAELGLAEDGLKTLLQRARAQLRACVERRMP